MKGRFSSALFHSMRKPYKIPESVLVVIFTPQWEVLLIRRADGMGDEQEFWQSVTGSKDFEDEAWQDTATREVWEETGIDCQPGTPLGLALRDWQLENVYTIYPHWLHRYAPGTTHNRERVFGLQVPSGCLVQLNPAEHTNYQWLPHYAAAEKCFSPSNAEAILLLDRFTARPVGCELGGP
jgi:dATP pyrophosphohydrolase